MRRLSEYAAHLVVPSGIVSTVWPAVERELASFGVVYDPWQCDATRVALGLRSDGKFAAGVGGVVVSIPRQVGKSFWVATMLVALCLAFPGLRVVWTSHHNRTTTNSFRTMQGLVKRPGVASRLARNGVRQANGEQEIKFANGSLIMFGAREQGFGRGIDAVDVLVFDEAQILGSKALEDMVPTTNAARNPHGGLIFFMGTPPRPTDEAAAFTAKRLSALSGKAKNLMYLEFSADAGCDSDDRRAWAAANPSFPSRVPLEAMQRMREALADEASWRREALGIWDDTATPVVVSAELWASAEDAESVAISDKALAVDVSPDGATASVSMAGRRADGLWHVELLETRNRSDWVARYVLAVLEANPDVRAVVVDVGSSARVVADDLTQAGVVFTAPRVADVGVACMNFVQGLRLGQVFHIGQLQLGYSLQAVRRRPLGRSGDLWAWSRRDVQSDITPVVSSTLALWGAQTSEAAVSRPRGRRGGSGRVVVL